MHGGAFLFFFLAWEATHESQTPNLDRNTFLLVQKRPQLKIYLKDIPSTCILKINVKINPFTNPFTKTKSVTLPTQIGSSGT